MLRLQILTRSGISAGKTFRFSSRSLKLLVAAQGRSDNGVGGSGAHAGGTGSSGDEVGGFSISSPSLLVDASGRSYDGVVGWDYGDVGKGGGSINVAALGRRIVKGSEGSLGGIAKTKVGIGIVQRANELLMSTAWAASAA